MLKGFLCALLFLAAFLVSQRSHDDFSGETEELAGLPGRASCREAWLADAWGHHWASVRAEGLESGAFATDWLSQPSGLGRLVSWSQALPLIARVIYETLDPKNDAPFLTSLSRSSIAASGPFYEDKSYNPSGCQFTGDQKQWLKSLKEETLCALEPLAQEVSLLYREAVDELLANNQFDRWLDEGGVRRNTFAERMFPMRGHGRRTIRGMGGGWQMCVTVDTAYFPDLDEKVLQLQIACKQRERRLRAAIEAIRAAPDAER